MSEVGSAFVSILPSAKGFGSKLESEVGGEVGSSGSSIGSKFGTALKVGAIAAVGGAVALGGFLKGAIGEAREAQKVGALTNAVIKSTGGIANVTAGQVDKLATAISLKTGVDDEAIAKGENMLLTFGNVRNEVGKGNDIFNQATIAANDMAAAFGGDAVSNSKMLGKALNDPTAGVSALTRVGVSFTQQQKDQIKAMQESGNVLGAQKLILGELTKQTGGAAEAQATAGDKLRVTWDNFRESIGTAVLPMFDKILTALTKFLTFLTNDIGPGIASLNGFVVPFFQNVAAYAERAWVVFSHGGAIIDTLRAAFGTIAAAFSQAFGSSGLGSGAGLMTTFTSLWMKLTPLLYQAGTALMQVIPIIANGIASAITTIAPILATMSNTFKTVVLPAITALVSYLASNLLPIFVSVAQVIGTQVVPIVAEFAQFIYGQAYPAVVKIASAIAANLKPILDQLFETFQAKILPALVQLLEKFREWQPTIEKVVMVILKIIGVVLVFAAAVLGKVIPVVIQFAGFLISKAVPAVIAAIEVIAKIIGFVIKMGAAVVNGVQAWLKFASGVANVIGKVIGFVSDMVGKIAGFYGKIADVVINAVEAWVKWQVGIVKIAGKVIEFVAGIPGKVSDALGDLGNYLYAKGQALIQGLIDGIVSKLADVASAIGKVAGVIKDHLPGSPVKRGPLVSWNNGGAGNRLVMMLVEGIKATTPEVEKAMSDMAQKLVDRMQDGVDRLKDVLSGLRSDMASLAQSVSQAFTTNLFDSSSTGAFLAAGSQAGQGIAALQEAFRKLKAMGASRGFLSDLFASGNSALIADLASGSRSDLRSAQAYAAFQDRALGKLGNQVARNEYGPRIDKISGQLDGLRSDIKQLAPQIAKELNGVAGDSARRRHP